MGYGNYYAVGRGLNKIFVGGILSIFSFIPLLGSILALVGLIPGVVILAALVIIPTAIASVVAGIQYLIFLYRAPNFLS